MTKSRALLMSAYSPFLRGFTQPLTPKEVEPESGKIVVFEERNIRRIFHNNEWWFAISNIVKTLTYSSNPSEYIKKMKARDQELAKG